MNTFTSLATAAALSFITLNVAQATDIPDGVKSLTVAFADLDLNKSAGAATLYARIKRAAHQVCNDFNGSRIREKQLRAECMEFATSNAVAAVRSPVLNAYVAGLATKAKAPVRVASDQ